MKRERARKAACNFAVYQFSSTGKQLYAKYRCATEILKEADTAPGSCYGG